MLTVLDMISLAGDRRKQNDDAVGAHGSFAWVIDGATDLHNEPLTDAATDACWIAQAAQQHFYANSPRVGEAGLRAIVREASAGAAARFASQFGPLPAERWKNPIGSIALIRETELGVDGLDLGDCRLFALDSDGQGSARGGPPEAADNESAMAAAQAEKAGETPLLRHAGTMDFLREMRARQNTSSGSWTFCLDPECANKARFWRLDLKRPAHVLLASDGYAALSDRYQRYDAAGFVEAALAKGVATLGEELRAIENDDSTGAQFPRWKRSDDATALLLRLD